MGDFLARLKQRKLVQWALAYIAFAFAVIQALDVIAQRFGWPASTERYVILVLAVGFCLVLVIAWYHGDRGAQRVGGTELLIIALLLAIGGGFIWRLGPASNAHGVPAAETAAATHPHAVAELASASSVAATTVNAQAIPAKSIAVLPFENLSTDKGNAYFADGMQDLILTKLADIGDLKVISRTSTEQYGSHPQNLKIIGEQLGVATILEGSVQKAGNEVLINVQLIDAKTDGHIWAQSYQRTLDNIFGVEGEVAEKVAGALKAKLSKAQSAMLAATPTQNQAAMDLFLRAAFENHRAAMNHDTGAAKRALALYRQAVDQDPGFALAYAQASTTESNLAFYGGGGEDVQHLRQQAREDAEQALRLAPNLAEAHLALGYSSFYGRNDFAGALKAFEDALALKPNDAQALAARGYVERSQLRFDDAIASLQQAFALSPRDSGLAYRLGTTNMMLGRYSEARDWLARALAINPDNNAAKAADSQIILFTTGDIPRALDAAQGDAPILKFQRVALLSYQRKYREALALLDSIPDTPDNFFLASRPLLQARLLAWMGDTAKARPLYERALATATGAVGRLQELGLLDGWRQVAEAELGLGRHEQALDAIAKSLAAAQRSPDQIDRPLVWEFDAAVYAQARRADLAVPLLAKALAAPGPTIGELYSPVLLWLDPAWDPIRDDPRFQALLKQYAKYKPAVIPAASAPSATAAGGAHD